MIGAYRATLDLLRRAGAADLLLVQDHLRIDYLDDRGWSSLDCPRAARAAATCWPGLAGAARCPGAARLRGAALRPGRALRPRAARASPWPSGSRRTGQGADARRLLWDPLATAILNETPERARRRPLLRRATARPSSRTHAASRLRLPAPRLRAAARPAGRVPRGARRRASRRRALAEAVEVEDGARRAACATRSARRRARRSRAAGRRTGARVDADAVVLRRALDARCPRLLPEDVRARSRRSPASARLGGRPSSPSSCGSTGWWWTASMVGLRDSRDGVGVRQGPALRPRGRAAAPGLHRQRGLPQRAAAERRAGRRRRRRRCAATSRPWPDATRAALARPARAGRHLRLRRPRRRRCARARRTPVPRALPGGRLDRHRPARDHRGRRAQRRARPRGGARRA